MAKAIFEQIVKNTAQRFKAFEEGPTLYHKLAAYEALATTAQAEAKSWKAKFDGMWSAYRKLAVETKGKDAAEKLMQSLHK